MVPLLDYDEDKKEEKKSQDEKRKHIKSIIDRIPTAKEDIFKYPIDWDVVDNVSPRLSFH